MILEIIQNESYLPKEQKTQCSATVSEFTQRWRYHRGEDFQCQCVARYLLDGVPYCRRHCGHALIERELSRDAH